MTLGKETNMMLKHIQHLGKLELTWECQLKNGGVQDVVGKGGGFLLGKGWAKLMLFGKLQC